MRSQITRSSIQNLSRTNLAYSLFEIAAVWICIASCFLLIGKTHAYVIGVVAFMLLTCLQQALLTLLHDSWHGLLCKNRKINDFVGRYVISFPCIKLWVRLKQEHLQHHVHLGLRDSDPTFVLYGFETGERRDKLFRFVFSRLGGRVLETISGAISFKKPMQTAAKLQWPQPKEIYWGSKGRLWKELVSILGTQCLIAWGISAVAPWWAYIVFWFVPLFTSTAACNLIRTFCEHSNPFSDDVPPAGRLLSFKSNWLELAFIAPLHFNYHAEHHLNMSVPHYRLPELRRGMEAGGPLAFPVRSTYFAVLREHFGTKVRR